MFKRCIWPLLILGVLAFSMPLFAQQKKEKAAEKAVDKAATGGKAQDKASQDKASQDTAKKADAKDQEDPYGEATGKQEETEKPASSEEKPAAAQPEIRQGAYTVRLKDLEDRVNRLKEQIFRSKARLSLLAETVLDRKIAGSKAVILFRNEMGGSFKLVKAVFMLDGAPIYNKADESGSLSDLEVLNLFDGPVMPGDHTLSVVLNYRGHGYGIFSYLKGYSFKTRSSRTFTSNEGKSLHLEVVGYEKGGATTPLEERPDVRYIMNVVDYDEEPSSATESKSAEPEKSQPQGAGLESAEE